FFFSKLFTKSLKQLSILLTIFSFLLLASLNSLLIIDLNSFLSALPENTKSLINLLIIAALNVVSSLSLFSLNASVSIKKAKSYLSFIAKSLFSFVSFTIDVIGTILFFSKYSHNSNALIKLGSFKITLVFLIGLLTGELSFKLLIN